MFVFPLIEGVLAVLCGTDHGQRHTEVKRNLCDLLSLRGHQIEVWFPFGVRKACPNGVTRYETWGTGSCDLGENVEKTILFRMHKLRWCTVNSNQKKTPRARRTMEEFREWRNRVKCESIHLPAEAVGISCSSGVSTGDDVTGCFESGSTIKRAPRLKLRYDQAHCITTSTRFLNPVK